MAGHGTVPQLSHEAPSDLVNLIRDIPHLKIDPPNECGRKTLGYNLRRRQPGVRMPC